MNNLLYFKYAVEVERTGSISRAAENLYMGQPHLSKAIRELEETFGIAIFNRTSKGVIPTERGAEFLGYAKNILREMEAIESRYKGGGDAGQSFDLTAPRASYIAHAFCDFVQTLDPKKRIGINYRETNSAASIQYVAQSVHDLAVIRYQVIYEQYFLNAIEERDLRAEQLLEFDHAIVLSEYHPLAGQKKINEAELSEYIEIVHGDISVPALPTVEARRLARDQENKKTISVYERASQFELLSSMPYTYMLVSPVPRDILTRYGLVQKPCETPRNRCKDLLISRKSYHFSEEDRRFIEILKETTAKL